MKKYIEKENKYCTECGEKFLKKEVFANKIEIQEYYSLFGGEYPLDSKFNKKTGKINICEVFECPNSSRFFNKHDRFVVYKGNRFLL